MANSKKSHKDRPTCQNYKRDRRWETNKLKRAKRVTKQLNTRTMEKKMELRRQYSQLENFNLRHWTLAALRKRVKRYQARS